MAMASQPSAVIPFLTTPLPGRMLLSAQSASRHPASMDPGRPAGPASGALPHLAGRMHVRAFVMAAVSVVLPWSTWPMVPTLRCGLTRVLMS